MRSELSYPITSSTLHQVAPNPLIQGIFPLQGTFQIQTITYLLCRKMPTAIKNTVQDRFNGLLKMYQYYQGKVYVYPLLLIVHSGTGLA
jgi:hypothetical protein